MNFIFFLIICNCLMKQNNFMSNLINNSDQIDANFDANSDVNFNQTDEIDKIDEF